MNHLDEITQNIQNFLDETQGREVKSFRMAELYKLKSTLSNINNLITYKMELALLDRLFKIPEIEKLNLNKRVIRKAVKSKNVNASGFDILFTQVIAEVKGTIPYRGGLRFGAAQKRGILKDLNNLLYGKSSDKQIDINKHYKFLALPDDSEKRTRAAMDTYLESNDLVKIKHLFEEYKGQKLSKRKVYCVYIKI